MPRAAVTRLALCLAAALTSFTYAAPPAVKLQEIAKGLDNPVHLTSDGTDRLFVVEQVGRIRLLKGGSLIKRPYLDIEKRVDSGGEKGLLSVAFHPKFAENGYFYVNYTAPRPLRTVISEFRTDPSADTVDPSTERVILTIDQPYSNHNGGQIAFGPDGMLYVGMGDGGSGDDPENRAQDPQSLLGKMLRIDVSPRQGYAVPKDNPFLKDRRVRPEIWTFGMRNPWRFSFDRETGTCYTGDVGQNEYEEVHVLEPGGNYGWNLREGTHPFRKRRGSKYPPSIFSGAPNVTDAVLEYPHRVGLSITGGFVYRGKAIPALAGYYLYADYAKGQIWALKYDEKRKAVTENAQIASARQPSSFGEDAEGELYVCDHGPGRVYKIVPAK